MREGAGPEGATRLQPPRGVKILSIIYSAAGVLLALLGLAVAQASIPGRLLFLLIGLGVLQVGRGLWKGRKWAAWAAVILALFQPLWPAYLAVAVYLLGLAGWYFNVRIRPAILVPLVLFLPLLALAAMFAAGVSVSALYEFPKNLRP
jgi:hypothetical protein